MTQLYTNNAISLLETNLLSSDLVFNVIPGDGDLFPQPLQPGDFFLITLEDELSQFREIIKVVQRIGDQLIIDTNGRGFEGTEIRDWPINSLVDHRLTAYSLQKIEQNNTSGFISSPDIIFANETKMVDTFVTQYPNKLTCKWILTILDETTDKLCTMEILAIYKNSGPSYTVYAKAGDIINYNVEVLSNNSNLELIITNNELNNLRINAIRINY